VPVSSVPTFFKRARSVDAQILNFGRAWVAKVVDLLELFQKWSRSRFVGFHEDCWENAGASW
jgi:hypothetical protein